MAHLAPWAKRFGTAKSGLPKNGEKQYGVRGYPDIVDIRERDMGMAALRDLLIRRPHVLPAIIAACVLLVALGKWPNNYYSLTRWTTTLAAIFVAYKAKTWSHIWAVAVFALVAITFNPVAPLHFARPTWQVIDALTAGVFLLSVMILSAPKATQQKYVPATMTVRKAQHILNIVYAALQDDNMPPRVRISVPSFSPSEAAERRRGIVDRKRSMLKYFQDCWGGYDLHQICMAINLQVAVEFLWFSLTDDPAFPPEVRADSEEKFQEGLELYDGGLGSVALRFAVMEVETDYGDDETPSSFGRFCKSVGAEDPLYWQKVYTRLGLEYTSSSPKGNTPVSPTPDDDE